ncbi:MAG: DNA cytosine methyltransferase [Bacteroides sp.]|nr:DNA cytosine methyltransferase [Roseburia sp.]MCM1346705.1 DNA cytosine methyltransferase [Bacteroides sp.]MCM1421470.1 DNA cytosine methyltransferase [Bacteroides sp.]
MRGEQYRILSLFANIGVAEAYLNETNCHVVVANELVKRRAALYEQIYPQTKMICGDITHADVYEKVIEFSKKEKVNVIIATPPCQGMSTAGEQDEKDERNKLVLFAISSIQQIHPLYAMIENVPNFVHTFIEYKGERMLLTDIIKKELEDTYNISINIVNTEDYGVPQSRERMIILLSKKGLDEWTIPDKETDKVTLREAIGWIPEIDPFVKDLSDNDFKEIFPLYEQRKAAALAISRWNMPPVHVYRQVEAMRHTPTGQTAFDNPVHKPVKKDGTSVKGYRNTYMRQRWDTPAYTVTMDNRKISSQGNVHPGRFIKHGDNGEDIYSDPRTLTLYELMLVMSIPKDWALPVKAEEAFVRRIIGEGIPPLFVKKLFNQLPNG